MRCATQNSADGFNDADSNGLNWQLQSAAGADVSRD